MLLSAKSYAFKCEKLSFGTRKAMLLDAGSYAFRLLEHCFQTTGVMLSDYGSSAITSDKFQVSSF